MTTTVLNPTLHANMTCRLGAVCVVHCGEPLDGLHEPDLRRPGRLRLRIVRWGETYSADCPFCGDSRGRLIGEPPVRGARPDHRVVRLRAVEVLQRKLSERPRLPRPAARHAHGGVGAGRCREPAVTRTSRLTLDEPNEFPGLEVPLSELAADHVAVAYLRLCGFDPVELDCVWGVTLAEYAAPRTRGAAAVGRIIVPVRRNAITVGWQARYAGDIDWQARATPKYLTYFPKSQALYGIDEAAAAPRVVLVEGCTDVWRYGPGAVCGFGKGLSATQVELLAQGLASAPSSSCPTKTTRRPRRRSSPRPPPCAVPGTAARSRWCRSHRGAIRPKRTGQSSTNSFESRSSRRSRTWSPPGSDGSLLWFEDALRRPTRGSLPATSTGVPLRTPAPGVSRGRSEAGLAPDNRCPQIVYHPPATGATAPRFEQEHCRHEHRRAGGVCEREAVAARRRRCCGCVRGAFREPGRRDRSDRAARSAAGAGADPDRPAGRCPVFGRTSRPCSCRHPFSPAGLGEGEQCVAVGRCSRGRGVSPRPTTTRTTSPPTSRTAPRNSRSPGAACAALRRDRTGSGAGCGRGPTAPDGHSRCVAGMRRCRRRRCFRPVTRVRPVRLSWPGGTARGRTDGGHRRRRRWRDRPAARRGGVPRYRR